MLSRRIVATLALVILGVSSIGTGAAERAGRSCVRCGSGCCAARGKDAACSLKAACCNPGPEERVSFDQGGKPGLIPVAAEALPPALDAREPAKLGRPPSGPARPPLDPPPRFASAAPLS